MGRTARSEDRPTAVAGLVLGCAVAVLGACSKEARPVGAAVPLTPPTSAVDPRLLQYQGNSFQVSQGGRYYTWYGCGSCHAPGGRGGPDLGLGRWRHGGDFDAVYGFIQHGHDAQLGVAGERIPAEQLWQITAYVRNLPTLDPQQRRRQDLDAAGEPPNRPDPAPSP